MENRETLFCTVNELKEDCARKQKKGIHFIMTSVIIWLVVMIIHQMPLPIMTKNLYTFCCSAMLFPIAYFISKIIKVDFQNKDNPLTGLGILFSLNQMIYILIAMWAYAVVPDKMVMIYAMIFGAHLLPFGWLYQSKTYIVFSVLIPILVLAVGVNFSSVIIAAMMLFIEIVFSISLFWEVRQTNLKKSV